MALPTVDQIRRYYIDGKWTEVMLRCALSCKSITQAEYDSIRAEKIERDAKMAPAQ